MQKNLIYLIILGVVASTTYLLSHAIMPFLLAFVLAYVMHPIIDKAQTRFKISRSFAVIIVFILFFCLLAIFLTIIIPILYEQIVILISKIPTYRNYIQQNLSIESLANSTDIDQNILNKIDELFHEVINSWFLVILNIFNNVWGYTIATMNVIVISLLVPIILFFFLKDWPTLVANIYTLLPINKKQDILKILSEIDILLSDYLRGQLNICLILMIYYCIGLTIIGLDQAILFGVLSGFLIVIPFIGVLVSLGTVLLITYFTYGFTTPLVYVVGLYAAGHFIESCILTPKIIGNKIGLHPLWIIFAVTAFGNLFGFIGVLLAIPMAGIINIFTNYSIVKYKQSDFYRIK